MTEQFIFDKIGGQCSAIDLNEWLITSQAGGMNEIGKQLLADTGLSL